MGRDSTLRVVDQENKIKRLFDGQVCTLKEGVGDCRLVVAAAGATPAKGRPAEAIRLIPAFAAGVTRLPFQVSNELRPAVRFRVDAAELFEGHVTRQRPRLFHLGDVVQQSLVIQRQVFVYGGNFTRLSLEAMVGQFELSILLFDKCLLLQQFGGFDTHLLFQCSVQVVLEPLVLVQLFNFFFLGSCFFQTQETDLVAYRE